MSGMGCMLLGTTLPSILPDFVAASDRSYCDFVCYGNAQGFAMVVGRNSSIRVYKLAYLRYFDSAWSVRRIFNYFMPFSSLRNVFRLIKQFKGPSHGCLQHRQGDFDNRNVLVLDESSVGKNYAT